jgi:hypothetical protein
MSTRSNSLRRSFVAVLATAISLTAAATAHGSNAFGDELYGISVGGAIQGEDPATLARDLDAIADAGARWVRLDINWAVVQAGGPSSYNWEPFDRMVQGVTERGMKVLGIIVYTPGWHRSSPIKAPDPQAYANFAREAAARYGPMGVHDYEIWNEPNISAFWSSPNPAAYTQLLKAASSAIKSVDPQARVLTGGLAPSWTEDGNYAPATFLKGIYGNGGGGHFDAVAHHPYCFPAMPGDSESWSAWYQMYGTPNSIRDVMTDNGDGAKKIWATEFGAPTDGPERVSEAEQAAGIALAYELWKTYDWAGPLFTYQGRDLGTDQSTRENFFGLLRHNFSPKPAYKAYRKAAGVIGDVQPNAGGRTKVEIRVKRRGKRSRKARGRVLVVGAAGKKSVSAGAVKLRLLEKSRRGWRGDSKWRGAKLGGSGRFDRRLAKLDPGRYRVRARYPGSPAARPAAAFSRSFRIKPG